MLKRHEITDCTEAILRRLRRQVKHHRIAFGVTPAIFVILGMWIGGTEFGALPLFMSAVPMVFTLAPMFALRIRISTLENRFAVWLGARMTFESDADLLSDPRVQFILGGDEWPTEMPTDLLHSPA